MTNKEIIDNINIILQENLNYCDLIIALKKFNKEYKKSNFYKQTHLSLFKLVKNYQQQIFYNLDILFNKLQEKINELNVDNLFSVLNKFEDSLALEVEDQKTFLNDFSELSKAFNENIKNTDITTRGK